MDPIIVRSFGGVNNNAIILAYYYAIENEKSINYIILNFLSCFNFPNTGVSLGACW
jgi:hypothetical protein